MFVFTLKCTTAATEETEVKIHDVVVNCKPMRPQVLPVSNTCVFSCGYFTRSNVTFE